MMVLVGAIKVFAYSLITFVAVFVMIFGFLYSLLRRVADH
ncbi:MAG: hypothetical protein K0R82_2526 [Flavipsychrobacter sp.]|nr:hypothetical protein [Flavipsychrobacter sp.]